MVIANATPLIYLAKANAIDLLFKLYEVIQIPDIVKEEVVDTGKKLGFPDAFIVEEYIDKGYIVVHELNEKDQIKARIISDKFNIDTGEAEVIILAQKKNEKVVIMDDKLARKTAQFHGLKPIGTLRLIREATKRGIKKKKEATKILNKLIDSGFRISIELYREFTNYFT